MSLQVCIDHGGRQTVTIQNDMAKSKGRKNRSGRSDRRTGRSKSGVSGSGDLRNVISRHRRDSYREEKEPLHREDLRTVLKRAQIEQAEISQGLSVQLNNMPFNDTIGRDVHLDKVDLDEHCNGISESGGKQKHVIATGNEFSETGTQKHVIAKACDISDSGKQKLLSMYLTHNGKSDEKDNNDNKAVINKENKSDKTSEKSKKKKSKDKDKDKEQQGIEWVQRKKKKSKRSRSRSAEKVELNGTGGPTTESLAEVTRLPLMPRWKSPDKDQKMAEERETRKRRHSPDPRGKSSPGESRGAKEKKRSRSQEKTYTEDKSTEKNAISDRKRSVSKEKMSKDDKEIKKKEKKDKKKKKDKDEKDGKTKDKKSKQKDRRSKSCEGDSERKSRKSRIDSGISGMSNKSPDQLDWKNACMPDLKEVRKESDSPLSGTSLSMSPPPVPHSPSPSPPRKRRDNDPYKKEKRETSRDRRNKSKERIHQKLDGVKSEKRNEYHDRKDEKENQRIRDKGQKKSEKERHDKRDERDRDRHDLKDDRDKHNQKNEKEKGDTKHHKNDDKNGSPRDEKRKDHRGDGDKRDKSRDENEKKSDKRDHKGDIGKKEHRDEKRDLKGDFDRKTVSPREEKKRDHKGEAHNKESSRKEDKHERKDNKGDGDKKDYKDDKRDKDRKEEKSKDGDRKEEKSPANDYRKENEKKDDRIVRERSPARRERRKDSRDSLPRRDNRSPVRRDREYERKRNYSGEGDRGSKRYSYDYMPQRPMYNRRYSSDFPPKRDYREMPRFPPAGAQSWEAKVESFLHQTKPGLSSQPDVFNPSAPPPYPPPFGGTDVVTLPDLSQPPPNMVPGMAGPPVVPPFNLVSTTSPTMTQPPSLPHTPVVPGVLALDSRAPNPYSESVVSIPYTSVPLAALEHQQPPQVLPMPVEAAPAASRSYSPVEPHVKGEFQPYDPNDDQAKNNDSASDGRNSETRERPVMTARQKKKIEKSRNPLWQFVAKMLLSDENFQQMRKKKKKLSPIEEREDIHRRADESAIRISLKLEKAGFDDPKLWTIVKDKGPQGLCEDLRVAVLSCIIETNPDSSKKKDVMDATLLSDGNVFKFIGQYIQANPFQIKNALKTLPGAEPSSLDLSIPVSTAPTAVDTMSSTYLQSILQQAGAGAQAKGDDSRSLSDLANFLSVQLIKTSMKMDEAKALANDYALTWRIAEYDMLRLKNEVLGWQAEREELYMHLLNALRGIPYDQYPARMKEYDLDGHLSSIVKKTLVYLNPTPMPTPQASESDLDTSKQSVSMSVSEEEPGFIGPIIPGAEEVAPPGANTQHQLPPRKYLLATVSVDTVHVEGRLVVWQVAVHVPGLPEEEDPEYEALMVPDAITDRQDLLEELGFTYNGEREEFYHQAPESGCRKAEPEEKCIEEFVRHLDELRNSSYPSGRGNNGLVLVFETGEDLGMVQQLLERHRNNIFLDAVKGVGCVDQFMEASKAGKKVSYTPPTYQYQVGKGGVFTSSVAMVNDKVTVEGESKAECLHKVVQALLGDQTPEYGNFIRWWCYPSFSSEVSTMAGAALEHILEMLPLQNHLFRSLRSNRIPLVMEGVYMARNEVCGHRPCVLVAIRVVRILVAAGLTMPVLRAKFKADPMYDISTSVFLDHMEEVQMLRVLQQTDWIRNFIKQYFIPNHMRGQER